MRHVLNPTVYILLLLFLLAPAGCGQGADSPATIPAGTQGGNMAITITSSAFKKGEAIPKKYTGEGQDVSPPLQWSGVPKETREMVLIVDDPDAPRTDPWVHWVIYSLPPDAIGLPEGVATQEKLKDPKGAQQGINDFKKIGYGGPMPPRGHGTHHYHFHVYALSSGLNVPAGETKKTLLEAMKGRIIGEGELIGTYERN